MNVTHYIGFDVHKKHINFCSKTADGELHQEGRLIAQRSVLREWASQQREPWHGAMEATLFSGWIYDTLKPYAARLDMAHPAMLKAGESPSPLDLYLSWIPSPNFPNLPQA